MPMNSWPSAIGPGLGQEAVVDVEVRAADGRGRHADDGVALVFDLRIVDGFDPNIAGLVEHEGFH